MKECPILFSAPMVRAMLDGHKTQTRRVVKFPHMNPLGTWEPTTIGGENGGRTKSGNTIPEQGAIWHTRTGDCIASPYGQPGDHLWVRETWRIGAWDENRPAFALDYCDGPRKEWVDVPDLGCDDGELFNRLWQQSTDDAIKAGLQTDSGGQYHWEPGQSPCRWRPSIHMPRWASRIQLEITDVRVERLQDISEADAQAEGVTLSEDRSHSHAELGIEYRPYRDAYAALWESISGPGSWDANPWIWVIEFKRVQQ